MQLQRVSLWSEFQFLLWLVCWAGEVESEWRERESDGVTCEEAPLSVVHVQTVVRLQCVGGDRLGFPAQMLSSPNSSQLS